MVVRKVRLGRSNMEYMLGYDCQIFHNMAIQDLRHNSDHIMVLGCLHGASPIEHLRYLGRRTRLPLRPPGCWTGTRLNKIFSELHRSIPNPDKQAERHNSWILAEMWIVVYTTQYLR